MGFFYFDSILCFASFLSLFGVFEMDDLCCVFSVLFVWVFILVSCVSTECETVSRDI